MTNLCRTILPVLLLGALAACGGSKTTTPDTKTSFAVMSDPHLLDAAALGASGPDFDAYVAGDRKMLAQSEETLDYTLADLASRRPAFLLICGDLTKDGEQVNHLLMASKLAAIEAQGIPVYVVPGNHDVSNPEAVSFLTSPPTAVPNIAPADFKTIYAHCGYSTALYQDPDSLSYIAEPVPGLWLFAIDSCEYYNNVPGGTETVAGKIKAPTMAWLQQYLALAKTKGKLVIGMEHHGVVEHFQGQSLWFPEYLLADYAATGKALSDAGMNMVFTGHFHANDISTVDFGTSQIYDCETGSTVTAPCPYRMVDLDLSTKTFGISTFHVQSIPSKADFITFETNFLMTGLEGLAVDMLTAAPYNVPTAEATGLAPLFAASMAAHYAGDESLAHAAVPGLATTITGMAASTDPMEATLGQFLESLWTDLPTGDNNATIKLK